MHIVNTIVPYAERCIFIEGGTAVIWPFLNVAKGTDKDTSCYELFLDTNALTNVQWYAQLPEYIRTRSVINPWFALQEQWLSNPQFRASPTNRIEAMIQKLAKLGMRFREQYAQQQVRLLRNNAAVLSRHCSLVVPYVAMMKSLLAQQLPAEQVLQRLEHIVQQDIPRSGPLITLTALGTLLKAQQSLKLTDDPQPAFSYLESFLAFQPGRKDETDYMNVPYLRNRAFDLNLWLTLPVLRQHGYRFEGIPAIVTRDRVLHRLILRVIPPIWRENLIMDFSLLEEGLPRSLCERVMAISNSVQVRGEPTHEQHVARISTLFGLAKACCADERERDALDQMFLQWWRPGFGKQIDFS
ncbi:hypothetical protein [Xylella fastidiosa]|uniref:hypothetical protein n=1 Tax=Xylella fastidiosa TaxID=2371 RepID=UPI0007659FFD|nr:hypothetical protein [Xylella fastidiosa]ALR01381.1 hypothetical protein OY18_03035 [Xylella fastidiosa]ALR08386.2 hypothetical protein XFFB_03040 [Xylella fastidiosa]KXB13223.1 hypothetical protein ADT29_08805 [Xylella fastidiosa]KXB20517.1 hypothetical protein ADT28_07505 [Xylella fastidiosa]MDG5823783.1 hypothetical protein [Xylella fastidiosa subsp. pauca]